MIRMKSFLYALPLHVLWLVLLSLPLLAQPASLAFQDCFTGNVSQKLRVSSVYAQVINDIHLNLTVLGVTPVQIVPASNNTQGPVATTLFTNTNMLTFTVWNNDSYFCNTLRPQSPLPALNSTASNYCPLSPGPFAFATTITLPPIHDLATFNTILRAVDPFQKDLLCIAVATTPLRPGDSVFGYADIIFWITVVTAICYWLVVGLARIVSAWGRGLGRSTPSLWHRLESAGFIFASALSGEKLATSPSLLRFCTPSLRDIIFHTQWCAALSMVALRWPQFVYPLLSQTAWSMLSYNITITQRGAANTTHWNPISVPTYNPPSNFADQLSDPNSPLFIDQNIPNTLFVLPTNVTTGIPAFAGAVGLHPIDLFPTTLILFLGICATTTVFSAMVWGADRIATGLSHSPVGTRSATSAGSKDLLDNGTKTPLAVDRNKSPSGNFMPRSPMFGPPRWRLRTGFSSFHTSVLQGNLVRILVLFHFPVTIFSCYQMTIGRGHASLSSIVLAAFSFCFISVLIPMFLLFRLYITNTSKLYDETWTLLALGPLYNHYRHGSQLFACLLFATNLSFGITIGCGQKNGTIQAILILVIEVVSALGTSFWLPWGQGASMGLISFLFCVARIVIAVLMVILTPVVSIADDAGQWVAYAILIIIALVYLGFILMLVIKIIEAFVRIFGGISFLRSRHVVDSGLFGACGLAGCCGVRKKPHFRPKAQQTSEVPRDTTSQTSLNRSVRVKPPHLQGISGNSTPPSVLRPEHALQPYREESDDEEGFIMGAWHSFPRPGYAAIDRQDSPKSSGFTRVGGGRSHFDTPYAIQTGSNVTFPSVDRPSMISSMSQRLSSPPPTPTVASVVRQNLPAGAMPPAHARTKSQTAVIEDSTIFVDVGQAGSSSRPDRPRRLSDDELSLDSAQPKKKPWFQKLRNRRHSEGNVISSVLAEPAAPDTSETEGRSFVVVRKGQTSDPTAATSSGSETRLVSKSFVVLRGNNTDTNNGTSTGTAL